MFCKGKDGVERRITYDDVSKDFGFMAAKGLPKEIDYGYFEKQLFRTLRGVFSGKIIGF